MGLFNFFKKSPPPRKEEIVINYHPMMSEDELLVESAKLVIMENQGSTSLIQRKFKIGYNIAGRTIDELEKCGIVSAFNGASSRELLIGEIDVAMAVVQKYQIRKNERLMIEEEERRIPDQKTYELSMRYKKEISLGLSKDQVIEILGEPADIAQTVTRAKIVEKLMYGSYMNHLRNISYKRMIKVEDGEVVGWKDL